jgi:hypothetical protein
VRQRWPGTTVSTASDEQGEGDSGESAHGGQFSAAAPPRRGVLGLWGFGVLARVGSAPAYGGA